MTAQAVVTKDNRPIDVFKKQLELAAPTLMHMVPKHVEFDKFKSSLVTAVAYDKELLECSTESLLREAAQAAELGLSLNKSLKEADILVIWNGKLQRKEAQMRPRFQGLMKLARQSGEIVDIYAHEVYSGDHFDYDLGLNKKLEHKPSHDADRGQITHAYVVWQTKDGIKAFEVLDRKRIDRSRDSSESYKAFKAGKIKTCTWVIDEGEMCRKTAVKAGSKYMPVSSEAFHAAVAKDNDSTDVDDYHGSFMDVTDTVTPPPAPTEAGKTQVDKLAEKVTRSRSAPAATAAKPAEKPRGAVYRIDPPEDAEGPDYHAWCEAVTPVIPNLTRSERTAWLKLHADVLEVAATRAPDEVQDIRKELGVTMDGEVIQNNERI